MLYTLKNILSVGWKKNYIYIYTGNVLKHIMHQSKVLLGKFCCNMHQHALGNTSSVAHQSVPANKAVTKPLSPQK